MTNPRAEQLDYLLDGSDPSQTSKGDDDLLRIVDIVRRRWWLLLLLGLLGLAVAAVLDSKLEPTYTASVLVERQEDPPNLRASGFGYGGTLAEEIASDLRLLQTRSVVGDVVDSVGLRLQVPVDPAAWGNLFSSVSVGPNAESATYELRRGPGGVPILTEPQGGAQKGSADANGIIRGPSIRLELKDPDRIPADPITLTVVPRERAVSQVLSNMRPGEVRGTNLIRIAYTASDPYLAAEVANALAESFKWHAARRTRDEARRRREAIEARYNAARDSLRAAQEVRADYLSESQNPQTEGSTLSSMLQNAQEELRELENTESALEELVLNLQTGGPEALRRMQITMGELVPAARTSYQALQQFQDDRDELVQTRTVMSEGVQRLDSLIDQAKREMVSITETQLSLHRQEVERARNRVSQLRYQVTTVPEAEMAREGFDQRVEMYQRLHENWAQMLSEAQIAESVETGLAQVIDPAVPPGSPDRGGQSRNLALGFIIGVLLGFGLSLVLDRVDHRIRSPDEAPKLARAELLATIPEMRESGNGTRPLVSSSEAVSSEAFRMLRTNLRFVKAETPRVLQVTSPGPREGKSIIAANLALSLAQEGKKVLVVDGDLRRPVQHEMFGLSRSPGLTDILVGEAGNSAVRSVDRHRVDLVTAGTPSPRPAELLGSEAFTSFVQRSLEEYDVLVVDAPPVLAVTDASVIGASVDGVLLVGRMDQTDRQALAHAAEQLRRTRNPLLGVIVNDVSVGRRYGGLYGYGYGYGYGYTSNGDSNGADQKKGFFGRIFRR